MDIYIDYKPFPYSEGICIHCGFHYVPKIEQMDLREINRLRKEFNESNDGKLKPLTRKEWEKWGKRIKEGLY